MILNGLPWKRTEIILSFLRLHPSTAFQRRQWHPTAVLLPGKSHGWRSPVGCRPWGRSESDRAEQLHFHFSPSCIGEGNGNPLQCSCLENPRDRGAWWVAIYEVAQSRTQLKRLSSSIYPTYKWYHMILVFLWHTSCSMTISRSIQVAANGIISLFVWLSGSHPGIIHLIILVKSFNTESWLNSYWMAERLKERKKERKLSNIAIISEGRSYSTKGLRGLKGSPEHLGQRDIYRSCWKYLRSTQDAT